MNRSLLITLLSAALACSQDAQELPPGDSPDMGSAQVDGGPADMGGGAPDLGSALPELSLQWTEAPPMSLGLGESISLSFGAKNDGAQTTAVVRALLCPGACDDRGRFIRLGETTVEGLSAGAQINGSLTAQVPAALEVADYSLLAIIDPDFSIQERDETNNQTPLLPVQISSLVARPEQLQMGQVPAGCQREAIALVRNLGGEMTLIESAELIEGAEVFSLLRPPFPQRVLAGEALELTIGFAPLVAGQHSGALELTHPQGSLLVQLSGASVEAEPTEERFVQLAQPAVDLLFVVDGAAQMAPQRSALVAQYGPAIIDAAARFDLRVGLIAADASAADAGQLIGGIIDAQSPDLQQAFSDRVGALTSAGGPSRGLQLAAAAARGGFLRQDAALAVIFVSSQDDRSPRPEDYYVSTLRDAGGALTINAIVGPPGGCQDAEHGARYEAAVTLAQGARSSICGVDWSGALTSIGPPSFGLMARFALSGAPSPGAITVLVDGVELPAVSADRTLNWTYDQAERAIVFELEAVPEAGAEVLVRYGASCR